MEDVEDVEPSLWACRFIFLFRRLFAIFLDLSLIGAGSFPLWIKHPLFILPCGWAYYAACSAWLGQRTPGMRLAGLHLAEVRPGRAVYPSAWRSPLCRTVLWGLPLTLASAGIAYLPFILLRSDGRTLHELAAGTRFFLTTPQETIEE